VSTSISQWLEWVGVGSKACGNNLLQICVSGGVGVKTPGLELIWKNEKNLFLPHCAAYMHFRKFVFILVEIIGI